MTDHVKQQSDRIGSGQGAELRAKSRQTVNDLWDSSTPRQRALLGILAVSHCHGLDRVPLILALAYEQTNARSLFLLADQIDRGQQPEVALKQIPHLLTPETVLTLELAQEDNHLTDIYRCVLQRNPAAEPESNGPESVFGRNFRLVLKTYVICHILVFCMLRVVPQFQKMLQEFDVEIPASMNLFELWFARTIALFPVVLILLFVLSLLLMPRIFRSLTGYLRRWNPNLWQQPIYYPAVNRRRLLAIVAQSGRSVLAGLDAIAEGPLNRKERNRFLGSKARIENGQEPWSALAAEKIITQQEAKSLVLTNAGPTQAWLLRRSASKGQQRLETRATVWLRSVSALCNIVLGLLTALFCIAVFQTLVSIISELNQQAY